MRAENPYLPFRAELLGLRQEAPGVRTYLLRPRGLREAPRAGQFMMIGAPGVGEAPISVSGFRKGLLMHTVKAVGRLTRWLQGLRPGDVLFLRGPYGRPWPLEEARGRHLLLLSGGMGLAPLRPVVGLFLSGRLGARRLSLLHGARRPRDIIFKEELSAWQGQGLEVLLTVDVPEEGWPGRVGLVTELLGELELEPHRTVAFICGPEIMMRFVLRELLIKGLSPRRLHVSLERRMRCGLGLCGHCQHGVWFVCRDGPVFSYPQVRGLPDGLL